MTVFHVTIEQRHVGGYEAIDNNRFDIAADDNGFTGYGIGDTPHEACQALIDSNRKVKLEDYLDEIVKARDLTDYQASLIYRHAVFTLGLWDGDDWAQGYALMSAVKLAGEFCQINGEKVPA